MEAVDSRQRILAERDVVRVLVMMGDPLLGGVLEEALRFEGLTVRLAGWLAEAYAALHQEAFDLLFVEASMLSSIGWDLVQLRTLQDAAGSTPIVLTTGYGELLDLTTAELGVADIIPKPFDLDGLLTRLAPLLPAGS